MTCTKCISKIRNLTKEHPIASVLVLAVVLYAFIQLVPLFFHIFPDTFTVNLIAYLTEIIYPIALVFLFGFGFTFFEKGFFKGIICSIGIFLPQVMILIVAIISNLIEPQKEWLPLTEIILSIIFVIGIGVREECFYRGIIQNILAEKYASTDSGIWKTVLISGFIFGITHATNIFHGDDPIKVFLQVIGAITVGFLFAAIYFRSRNLISLIIVHTVIDAAQMFDYLFLANNTELEVEVNWFPLIGAAIYALLALFLLRKSKRSEIIEKYKEKITA